MPLSLSLLKFNVHIDNNVKDQIQDAIVQRLFYMIETNSSNIFSEVKDDDWII